MNESLAAAGFTVVNEGLRNLWNPTVEVEEKAIEFGKELATMIK
jgi:hypothetical protein